MKILAISGSLRSQSSNSAILRAAKVLAPAGIEVELFDQLGDLKHFNPDLEETAVPATVSRFRAQVASPAAGPRTQGGPRVHMAHILEGYARFEPND